MLRGVALSFLAAESSKAILIRALGFIAYVERQVGIVETPVRSWGLPEDNHAAAGNRFRKPPLQI